VFGLGGFSSSTTPAPTGPTPPVVPASSGTHHVTPPPPSETIVTLQRELAQLDYYEGPITGTMNEQTVHAIKYLQRDAHLPQTGSMNAAAEVALDHFLVDGNNQMGG
jgi:peptidoglycan hydrolase-like protein with peptidoglycan-binding domain